MVNKILVTTQMMIHDQDRFQDWLIDLGYEVDFVMNEQFLSESECLELEPIYTGWIAGDDEVTSVVIDHLCPQLKIISKWGTGLDSIDISYAKVKGLTIKNSPGAFKDAVGELAVGYLLALTRGIVKTHVSVMSESWPKQQYRTLVGMKVGLVGLGAIGLGVAQRLSALGCEIVYCDPRVNSSVYKKIGLDELCSHCEALVLTCNLNATTHHLVNKEFLSKSKKGLFVINVGRGALIDEAALLCALESNDIGGAALDVYEAEPLPKKSKIRSFDNVILGSHNANNTVCAVEFVHKNTISQLDNFLKRSK